MVIGLVIFFALSLLGTLVVFSALILGSRADRLIDAAVFERSERRAA
jgi:hypothetical protein